MTILYADDDRDDCELLSEALEKVDPSIACIIASDGIEVLNILHQQNELPDYIFLDVNMPMMDGKECLVQLKKDKKLKHIPVIIYSTTTNTREIKDLFNLGAFDFMSKAYSFAELCVSLRQMINKLKLLNLA